MREEWVERRVYGASADDVDSGPESGREYVELVGGPLDGLLLDVTGWSAVDRAGGAALIADGPSGVFGPGGRAWYGPPSGDPVGDCWYWEGDTA
jgi:hypothetical protein